MHTRRTILWVSVGAVVLALLLYGFMPFWRWPSEEHKAEVIRKLGGSVQFSTYGSPWLRRWLGDRVFQRVSEVQFPASAGPFRAKDLHVLGDLGGLTVLSMSGTSVSDRELGFLPRATRLELLDLAGTAITDRALGALPRIPKLRQLVVDDTRITSAGLASLAGADHLEVLNLARTDVGDEGVGHLRPLRSLAMLSLADTKITDDAAQSLASLTKLEWLDVSGTAITDRGLAILATAPSLQCIVTQRTLITSAGRAAAIQQHPSLSISMQVKPTQAATREANQQNE